jgi:sedoheptulokinase
MGLYLAIDLGSSSVTALLLDTVRGIVRASESTPYRRETTTAAGRTAGRSEWDLDGMALDAIDLARRVVERASAGTGVDGIGVTGQQHGCQLLGADGSAVGPFIGWQDRRAAEPMNNAERARTWVDVAAQRGGARRMGSGLPRFAGTGCPLEPKQTAALLFWLHGNGAIPAGARAVTAPDYLMRRLTGGVEALDPTCAHGWGAYDVEGGDWHRDLIAALGLHEALFPPLAPAATVAGSLAEQCADRLGLPSGTPVAVASGDHQCSFAGSVARPADSVAVNVGTGGQVSVFTARPLVTETLELRPFIGHGYLLTSAGAVGGRQFRYLREFARQAAELAAPESAKERPLPRIDGDTAYERLVDAAEAAGEGAGGVVCEPRFDGTPEDAGARASFAGLTATNFTPGNLARALLHGIARELYAAYREAVALGAGERSILVGSGNGIRRNRVLRHELARRFGADPSLGSFLEEAAVGAALCAAVASGEHPDIVAASGAVLTR